MFNKKTKIMFVVLIVIVVASILFINFADNKNNENQENIIEVLSDKSCGFTLISPKEDASVYKNFTVEAIVDNTNRAERGCGWTVFEGQAGLVHVYDTKGFSVGSALLIAKDGDWMKSGPVNFEADIVIDIEPNDKNLLLVIEEDDPAGLGDSELLQIPLKYSK